MRVAREESALPCPGVLERINVLADIVLGDLLRRVCVLGIGPFQPFPIVAMYAKGVERAIDDVGKEAPF